MNKVSFMTLGVNDSKSNKTVAEEKRVLELVSARFIDASMHRDTCHAIRIAIQFASIVILKKKKKNFFFFFVV